MADSTLLLYLSFYLSIDLVRERSVPMLVSFGKRKWITSLSMHVVLRFSICYLLCSIEPLRVARVIYFA